MLWSVSIDPNNKFLIYAGDNTINIWDLIEKRIVGRFSISLPGTWITLCLYLLARILQLFLGSEKAIFILLQNGVFLKYEGLKGTLGQVLEVGLFTRYSFAERILATSNEDDEISVWTFENGNKPLFKFKSIGNYSLIRSNFL